MMDSSDRCRSVAVLPLWQIRKHAAGHSHQGVLYRIASPVGLYFSDPTGRVFWHVQAETSSCALRAPDHVT
jgi:hypothetical protein